MKFLFVFVSFVVVVSAAFDDEFKQKVMAKVQEVGVECAEKENASGDDIGELLAKKSPSRKEGKCLLACFNEKFEIQDKDGKMSMDGAMKSIEPFKVDAAVYGKMKEIFEACIPEVGDTGDRCENAVKMAACSKKMGEKLGVDESLLM